MATPKVRITNKVTIPGGATAVGGLVLVKLSHSATASDGSEVLGGGSTAAFTAPIASDGSVDFLLDPNDALTPSGTYYEIQVRAKLSDGGKYWAPIEKWQLASTPDTIDIGAVPRLDVVPGSAATVLPLVAAATLSAAQASAAAAAVSAASAAAVVAAASTTWSDPRGDAEMAGDADYFGGAKVMGWYALASAGAQFNRVLGRVWCTDTTTAVEWKVWLRPSASSFNMSTTAPDDSGTIAAASFPHANAVLSLALNKTLIAAAGQYVFVMFRASNDSPITSRKWGYDASVTPARHGFPFAVGAGGWNQGIVFGDPAAGYGQIAIKLQLGALSSDVVYDPTASGLASRTAQAALDEVTARTAPSPTLVLPPTLYATQGREVSAYFDNLLPEGADGYLWDVTNGPAEGVQQNERWTVTPAGSIAQVAMTIAALDRRSGAQRAAATLNVIGAAAAAGTGSTPKCIFIGDSLTNAAVYTQELLTIAAGDALKIALYGTRGIAPNSHEGRGGWTIANYTSNFSDGTYGANPFWIGGAVNFPQYLTNNAIPVPDWVFIMLGINDVFSQTSDAGAISAALAAFTNLDTLVTSIKAAGAGVKVGLMTPTPPSADQDAFGANYASGQTRWRFKRNIALWAQQVIARYSGQTANRIWLVPTHLNLDTVNNMVRAAAAPVNSRSTVQVSRQGNGVHPDTPGYKQIADTVWAFLKNQF